MGCFGSKNADLDVAKGESHTVNKDHRNINNSGNVELKLQQLMDLEEELQLDQLNEQIPHIPNTSLEQLFAFDPKMVRN